MKVEIWSDVMCPFCYIGKRRFEKALEQFSHKDKVEVIWKSFQLNPGMKTDAGKNITEYLAEIKGWTVDQARELNVRVTEMASKEGLMYDFDRAIVANSFDAHRLIQMAKSAGKGDEMEEELFKAYFTEGKNTADHHTLIELGAGIGLSAPQIKQMLTCDDYAENVERDIYESQQIGVKGVPYFVFDDKYAITGAQASETFLGALNKSWQDWEARKIKAKETGVDLQACNIDGACD